MQDVLRDGLAVVVDFVPKLLLFLVILIIGIIIAKLIYKALSKLLRRVGFDKVVAKAGIQKFLEKSSIDATDLIAKIVYYALVLFVLQFAFSVFGPNAISDLLTQIIAFIPKLIVAIIIVIIVAAIASGVKSVILSTLGGQSYGKVLANIASIFIIALGIIAALNQIGIATAVTTPILVAVLAAVVGVIIVGVGGGLIAPMRQRWESGLSAAEREVSRNKRPNPAQPGAAPQQNFDRPPE